MSRLIIARKIKVEESVKICEICALITHTDFHGLKKWKDKTPELLARIEGKILFFVAGKALAEKRLE